jgi:hypothetical protein
MYISEEKRQLVAIAKQAELKWRYAGMPEGRSEEFWLAAEREYFAEIKRQEVEGHWYHTWKQGLLPSRLVCGICGYERLKF